jgi:hypothetical protein
MGITTFGAQHHGVDLNDSSDKELDNMVTRFLKALQPGKAEVELLYQRFLFAAQEASEQIRANEERRQRIQESSANV